MELRIWQCISVYEHATRIVSIYVILRLKASVFSPDKCKNLQLPLLCSTMNAFWRCNFASYSNQYLFDFCYTIHQTQFQESVLYDLQILLYFCKKFLPTQISCGIEHQEKTVHSLINAILLQLFEKFDPKKQSFKYERF